MLCHSFSRSRRPRTSSVASMCSVPSPRQPTHTASTSASGSRTTPAELGAQRVGDKLQHRTTLRPRPQRHDIHVQHRLLPLREQRQQVFIGQVVMFQVRTNGTRSTADAAAPQPAAQSQRPEKRSESAQKPSHHHELSLSHRPDGLRKIAGMNRHAPAHRSAGRAVLSAVRATGRRRGCRWCCCRGSLPMDASLRA
jgi:hypothetical protein